MVVRNTSIEDNLEEPLELSSFKPYQIGQRCSTFRTNGMVEVPQAQHFYHRRRHANVQGSDRAAVSTACSREECRTVTLSIPSESESCSVVSSSVWSYGLYSPWNSPGKNTGVASHSLLQGIFPTQGSNSGMKPRSPALQADSLPAEPQGKPTAMM